MRFFALTPEAAEKFFQRCIEREAVTMPEREAIMKELEEENQVLLKGSLDNKTSDALQAFFDATAHKGAILLRENKENGND